MQFLVRKTTHTTGEVFFDVTRAKENEEFIVVDAENKEDAEKKRTEALKVVSQIELDLRDLKDRISSEKRAKVCHA